MIKQIRLKNCQSFEDVTYTFAEDRLNVIVAENDTGKSILYKVLKLAGKPDYYSNAERRDLIRRGAEFAQVTMLFTDGSFGAMQIFKDKTVYSWVEDLEHGVSWWLEPPVELLDRLGLLVSPTESFIANIIDTDQGLLLVDPRLASNYELVKLIATCEDLDLIRERVEPLIQEFRSILLREKDNLGFFNRQLEDTAYVDVEKLERKRTAVETAEGTAEVVCSLYECIEKLPEFGGDINFDDALTMVEVLEKLESLGKVKFPTVGKEIDTRPLEVLELLESAKEMVGQIRFCREGVPVALANSLITLMQVKECIEQLSIPEEVKGAELVEPLSRLEQVVGLLKEMPDCHAWDKTIEELEKLFSIGGETVDCPIYGKVVFDGKECVADSK